MPLHRRQVTPINVGRKYPPKTYGLEYLTSEFQLIDANEIGQRQNGNADESNNANTNKHYYAAKDQDYLVNSKEEESNRRIANIVRQLASLSLHAHDIFGKR